MDRTCVSRLFAQRWIFLAFLVVVQVAGQEICDITKCPGPLKYYQDLGCTPVYKSPGDCCPQEYNCDHLASLSKQKCYMNGHEYNVGEALREEDRNPCDVHCRCHSWNDSVPFFFCAIVDCFGSYLPGCYQKRSPDRCCGTMVCPSSDEERATCEVDGKVYKDGEYFQPKSNPELNCYCQPGYKGENVLPFCKKPNRNYCSPLFKNAEHVHQKCAPVYLQFQSPQEDCNLSFRCPNPGDTIIRNNSSISSSEENKTCQFGDMKMHIGDELNQGTDYDSVCVKCVCEVPPTPTCKRLPDSECDATKQQPFMPIEGAERVHNTSL